ncbi:polysaccharide deacetylase family protein [Paenibacillus montanisoli]|uniref:Polysaccharide deacetylase family protein n=1 Tax=Paenibacillus montanisoli TaxID=2081970 RepID=A0A328U7J9_9BACL|nr:polysaccharide deacetylase family protein [Paenibacillus montanisoli]RAP76006.1 polysaccharide deacetylase family protein [Paenibacillus montanisoli]
MKAAEIINEVQSAGRLIAITFDDVPDPEWTPQFLDVFKQHGAKATFYTLGTNMAKYPEIARQIHEEGHELGNHSLTHPHMPEISKDEQRAELQQAEQLIVEVTGRKPNTFRPPYLDVNDDLLVVAAELGYKVIHGLNLRANDWAMPGTEHILAETRPSIRDGSILLFHDAGGDRSQSLEALSVLVPELLEQGYRLVTVSELLGLDR